jgi:hypothetical protein
MAFDVGLVFVPQTLVQTELLYVNYTNDSDCRLLFYDAFWVHAILRKLLPPSDGARVFLAMTSRSV